MAQGCILPLTHADNEALRASLRDPLAQSAYRAAGAAAQRRDLQSLARAVSYPLSDPKHPAHQAFVEHLLRNVAGNESIFDAYKAALPGVVAMIARQCPSVSGLVAPSRGAGASAWDKTLAHSTRGNGFAYELLGTAELMRMHAVHGVGSAAVNEGGPSLQIFKSDDLNLGFRLQAGYGEAGRDVGLYRPSATTGKGFRGTFEADLLITRSDGLDWHTVGVDFKHVGNSGGSPPFDHRSESQLQAIANGMLTGDMNLREFHFATNGAFSAPFKEAVEAINREIIEKSDGDIRTPPIGLHEKLQYPLN